MTLDDYDRTILSLLADAPATSSGIARAVGVSRQAAHARLSRLIEDGRVCREGAARATRNRLAPPPRWERRYPLNGLAEDKVYAQLAADVPAIASLEGESEALVAYVVTEMVNNAIDHSSGEELHIAAELDGVRLRLEIDDDGVGAFEHVRDVLGLPSDLAALQKLSKGKTTTAPEKHTGEGLFFTAKAVALFRLDSGGLGWIVDNERDRAPVVGDAGHIEDLAADGGDMAVVEIEPPRRGTLVALEIDLEHPRSLIALVERSTEDYEFSRTRTVVKLFTIGVRFVSRLEAKRLLHGLERFREVVLDFRGVDGIGQGFADEVFRVWARAHPETRLVPVNMNRVVEFMQKRVQ